MFLTLTLGSYGPVTASGSPAHPGSYDYRRAALDALHFPKLVDRFSGRTSGGALATGCSTSRPLNRNAGSPRICTPPSGVLFRDS